MVLVFVAAYVRKKYLWKLMYTKMLGYDVEFGHKQAMDLMASSRLVFNRCAAIYVTAPLRFVLLT